MPVQEVEPLNRVTQYIDAPDGGVGPGGHDVDVVAPGELLVEEEAEVANPGRGRDTLEATDRVPVVDAEGVASDEVGVSGPFREGDELGLVRVSREAIPVEPLQNFF